MAKKIQQKTTLKKESSSVDNLSFRKVEMISALRKFKGNVSKACDEAGIDRTTHYTWLKTDQDYNTVLNDIREARIDRAEDALDDLIEARDAKTVQWYLDRQGKDRGYVQKSEVDVNLTEKEAAKKLLTDLVLANSDIDDDVASDLEKNNLEQSDGSNPAQEDA